VRLNEWIAREASPLPCREATQALDAYLASLDAAECLALGELIEAYGSQCAKERCAIESLRLEAHFFRPHNECPCCKEDIALHDGAATSCMHLFHAVCLAHWLDRHNECPVCRTAQ